MFKVRLTSNKNYEDHKRKLQLSRDKFNGRVQAGEGAEASGDAAAGAKLAKKSAKSILTKGGT